MIKIIFKTKDYAIVQKPAGVLSQKDASGENGLVELLSEQLGTTVYPIHRLDRPVGGVMVFALNKKCAAALSAQGALEKEYIALVSGVCPIAGEMKDYLFKDTRQGKSFVVDGARKGAKEARLTYERLDMYETEHGPVSRVRIKLQTGRTHQIRVQFSSRGMSLLGDGKYGSRVKRENIALWSSKLTLIAPENGKKTVFEDEPSF